MFSNRTFFTCLSAALVAGGLSAQAPLPATRASLTKEILLSRRYELGLDQNHDFAVRRSHVDAMGMSHSHIQQTFGGVKVWGGEIITHTDAMGRRLPDTNALRQNIRLSVEPTLQAGEALALVHQDLQPKGPYAYEPTVELVIYPHENGSHSLAYHVHTQIELSNDTRHTDYIVDAHSGHFIQKWNSLRTSDAVGTGYSQYSGTVSIHTNYTGSLYELKDVYRSMSISTLDARTGKVFTDADNIWGDGQNYPTGSSLANGQTAGVDAHYGAEITFDFFKNLFGRNGIDGNNKAMYSRVHYSTSYDNVYWDDTCFCMTYGDGSSFKTLTAPDMAGHEMSHGVCSTTANLTYSGEPGALNEASSDIFGNMIELYSRNNKTLPATVASSNACWTAGEQLATAPLRYMYKPSKDGYSPNAWSSSLGNLDVHYGSGPANRMFFFLSQGASATSSSDYYSQYTPSGFSGLGPEKAVRIWYRALTTYMTSSTNYANAGQACMKAATDLYGASSAECAAVRNAFAAINVSIPLPNLVITPSSVTLQAGAARQFTATLSGQPAPSVTWTCTGGTITTSGLYTAGSTPGTYSVKASTPVERMTAVATVVITNSAYNEVEDNGSISKANAVPDASTKIVGYVGSSTDVDYFKVKVGAGVTLNVAMTGPSGKNYDLYLYNGSGALLKSSTGSSSTESVSYKNSGSSAVYYYIKVKGYSGAYSTTTPYNLALTR